jgi:hypothetical protein
MTLAVPTAAASWPSENRIGPEPGGALQCNTFRSIKPQQHHGPIKLDKQLSIGGEGGERPFVEPSGARWLRRRTSKRAITGSSFYWSDSASNSFSFGVSAAAMQYCGEFASVRMVASAPRGDGIHAVVETATRR